MWSIQRSLSTIPLLLLWFDINVDGHVSPIGAKGATSLSALWIIAWTAIIKGAHGGLSRQEVEYHLEMGKKLLSAGQLADALSHYHTAIEGDPTNYMSYYRRATVLLALGKSKSALPDLDKVIELRPDFISARLQRGNVRLKQGNLEEARKDYTQIIALDPTNSAVLEHLLSIDPIVSDTQVAQQLHDAGRFQEAVDMLAKNIELCPWDPALRELRAACYVAQGDYFRAIGDLRPTTKLRPDNTAAYMQLSTLHYKMGEADESLENIRECLKLDQDHKACHAHYRLVKKLVKQQTAAHEARQRGDWHVCVERAQAMQTTEPHLFTYQHRAQRHICHCYTKLGQIKEAFAACNKVLESDENNIDGLCDRAEVYILNEQFDEAISDYQKADGISDSIPRVQQGLKKAQKLLKQSKKRDYYKILGIRRTARKSEIVKAYRKLAVKWHPDRYRDELEKKKAERMFIDIAAAKEVLSDPEKRAKFDQGEDPLDPEQQSGGGGGPFWQQGFDPFGHNGFKFHFN